MKVVPFADVAASDWDAFVDRSPETWLFHRTAWIPIEAAFFADHMHAFAIRGDDGSIAGICPLYERRVPRIGWIEHVLDTGQHRHAGLAVAAGAIRDEARRAAMAAIVSLAERLDVDRVQMNQHNLSPALAADGVRELPFWIAEYGFHEGLHVAPNGPVAVPGLSSPNADQLVPLAADETALFDRLEASCRRAIRKAERSGLSCAPADDADPVAVYYELATRSAERTGERLLPIDYYRCVWTTLSPGGRCTILLARLDNRPVGALLLIADRGGVAFLGGVSDPAALPYRVNDLLHWEAIRWAKRSGASWYRLGPVFPTASSEWPIARVSRFKAKFGAVSRPIVQGTWFRHPDRYRQEAQAAVTRLCAPGPSAPAMDPAVRRLHDVATHLRRYGFLGFDLARGAIRDDGFAELPVAGARPGREIVCVFPVQPPAGAAAGHAALREGGRFLYAPGRKILRERTPVYRALLPHLAFDRAAGRPIWVDETGLAVIAWREAGERLELVVGVQPDLELRRYTHGDPAKVDETVDRARFGFGWERPNYLYDANVVPRFPTAAWADALGFTIAEALARESGLPLVAPLPRGARGLVLLTGDDDQAELERYGRQLDLLGGFPITYYLHPLTKHTPTTLAAMPASVQFGVHIDAVDTPDRYDELCFEQCGLLRELCGQPSRTVRNHGYLNRGYLGHLDAWERCGLWLDANYPGVDGTALTGSFLPFRTQRPDGSWSSHYGLLTPFGDGMLYALKMTADAARRRIRAVAAQLERTRPGVLVFNFHPQNIIDTVPLHEEVLAIARRPGWHAVGAETYLDWLQSVEGLTLSIDDGAVVLRSAGPIRDLALREPVRSGWADRALPAWSGTLVVRDAGPA